MNKDKFVYIRGEWEGSDIVDLVTEMLNKALRFDVPVLAVVDGYQLLLEPAECSLNAEGNPEMSLSFVRRVEELRKESQERKLCYLERRSFMYRKYLEKNSSLLFKIVKSWRIRLYALLRGGVKEVPFCIASTLCCIRGVIEQEGRKLDADLIQEISQILQYNNRTFQKAMRYIYSNIEKGWLLS